jgi:hypothetical protein
MAVATQSDIELMRRRFDVHVVPHLRFTDQRPRDFNAHAVARTIGGPYAYYLWGTVTRSVPSETLSYAHDGVSMQAHTRLTTINDITDLFTTVTVVVDGISVYDKTY